MRSIIFIAPPAAGKGTQSKLISEKYHIPHISTGDLLRDEIQKQTKLGQEIKNAISKGQFVSDEIITKLLRKRLTEKDCKKGYILDGYPRNKEQAIVYEELLEELNINLDLVIFLDIPKDLALKRTINRLTCPKCGYSYNLLTEELRPIKEGICDNCHESLRLREDDTKEVFLKRFDTYINKTKELVDYYKKKNILETIIIKEEDTVLEIFDNIKGLIK